ncbi:MAG: hypothetical protein LBG76_05105 [Treponema sp.]|jgi:hypothetical protein|nr:hypothetical protein [Treponema sp.]
MLKKLGKLLRYDFLYYFRIMPVFYLALALSAVAAGIQERAIVPPNESAMDNGWLIIVFGCVLVAVVTVNLVLIFQRFRENLLKDPGYLMFTLPVTVWSLTASKAVSAFCMFLLSILACFAASLLMGLIIGETGKFTGENLTWTLILEGLRSLGPGFPLFMLTILVFIFKQICLIYVLISASQILPRFRALAGFAVWFLVVWVEQFLVGIFLGGAGQGVLPYLVPFTLGHVLPYFLVNLVFAALYFYGVGLFLKKTLNME